jgi:adenine-specific DNA-methyltransferase
MKAWLEAWGSQYVERDLKDGKAKALVIKGAPLPGEAKFKPKDPQLQKARAEAERIRAAGNWPVAHWRDEGQGTFGMKKYLKDVKQGIVPTTYWSQDDYDEPLDIGSTSWEHTQSGHSQAGINELAAIIGRDNGFDTVKPLRLFKKIIQIWCPPAGIVLDPFAGSGTTGHAVLDLNAESGSSRRFILMEQGRPEKGDTYARGLTAERIRRVISGKRVNKKGEVSQSAKPLKGGFRFVKLDLKVDRNAVLALEREEMIDLLLTSHWDQSERSAAYLRRLPAGEHKHLFAVSTRNEGFFVVWNGPGNPAVLDRTAFREIVEEAKAAGLSAPYHVYARTTTYSGPNIEFYQIPDRILEKLGFNESVDAYSNVKEAEETTV